MKPKDIEELEQAIGHRFRNRALLERAMTHSSFAREFESQNETERGASSVGDNEQLEFLGDAVLALVTSEALLGRYPQFKEGQLSKLRAHLVSEKHLIRTAKKLKLGKYLRLGHGEEKSGGRSKIALQVDALEALLAALYLDAGIDKPGKLILEIIVEPELKRLRNTVARGLPITDYKSALQEALHSSSRPQPVYVLIKEDGPEHRKTFTVEARIGSSQEEPGYVGRGEGSTKKTAEQDAAKKVFQHLFGQAKPARKGQQRQVTN
jgi:ribonuclease-3